MASSVSDSNWLPRLNQGVAESEAHCINADANHTRGKFSQFVADIYHFDANKRIYFSLQEFPTFT